ncbi:MAG: hypothetical protein AAF547_18135 [Actinomycetota bacterium]
MTDTADPILVKRARIARWTSLSLRIGAGCYLAATVLFAIALATEFTGALAVAMTVLLLAGSAILAPAMVIHYAIKAADRADRENSW